MKNNGITEYFEEVEITKEYEGYYYRISKVSHSRKNRHGKASKNGMKQSISLKCSTFDSHLFHGSLDNEPLAVWVRAIRRNSPQGGSPWQKPTTPPNSLSSDFRGINAVPPSPN